MLPVDIKLFAGEEFLKHCKQISTPRSVERVNLTRIELYEIARGMFGAILIDVVIKVRVETVETIGFDLFASQ